MSRPIRVLFVCLGNICRSPLGEGILREMVKSHGLHGRIEVDSAGTGAYHVGEKPNKHSIAVAQSQGIDITGQRARQLTQDDFNTFNYILAMDRQNLRDIHHVMDGSEGAHIELLLAYHPNKAISPDVPDPYYGGKDGFVDVYNLIYEACAAFLDELDHEAGG